MSPPAIVVVGASAGGTDALVRLLAQFPADFPAAVFVVLHMAADNTAEHLLRALQQAGPLTCSIGKHDEAFRAGRVYLAPPDHHMMLGKGRIVVTKGARENRTRPSIDPLFRSAAVAYGNRVVGVVLTGYLDDGTAGLTAIQLCGGTCVVQDPADAAYPDMPQNAMAQVKVDHCIPLAEMGAVLTRVVQRPYPKRGSVPDHVRVEAKIAERVLSDLPSVESLGELVPFNCPGCGGVLWQIEEGDALRFRCHTGHAFTAPVLLAEQTAKIEETLWVALRMFEERRNLLTVMSSERPPGLTRKGIPSASGNFALFASARERAQEADVHIARIRELLRTGESRPRR